MRSAPAFWWRDPPGPLARLLAPAGQVYGAATAARMAREGARLPVPVLCVGNFVAGGAGKTPTALALAEGLSGLGHRPAFLSRGYGRRLSAHQPIAVDLARHTAAEVGDEPLLLARTAPTFVATDRVLASELAVAAGATVLILDDGLQNPMLHKDVTVAVVDGRLGVGNGHCVPAGPLRAPLAAQWPHVAVLCTIGAGDRGMALAAEARRRGVRVWRARLEPDRQTMEQLKGRRLFAFAGIGQPSKFFETIETCGLQLAGARGFPDHHRFTPGEVARLHAEATRLGATLVTTEKDRVRLAANAPVVVLPVSLAFDDPGVVAEWLADRLSPAAHR